MKLAKSIKEDFYKLLEEPNRENFTKYISDNTGEHSDIDFKESWIDKSCLAKIILAIANVGGGLIIVGVKECDDGTYEPIGLEIFKDEAILRDEIKKFIPETMEFELHNFDYSGEEYSKLKDKKFQALFISSNPVNLPYISASNGDRIEDATIYVRHGAKTEKATNEDFQRIISRRIDTAFSNTPELELQEQLSQLKTLYQNIDKYNTIKRGGISNLTHTWEDFVNGITEEIENPIYPEEDFDHFIVSLIKEKKKIIKRIINGK